MFSLPQIDTKGPYVTPEFNSELQCNVGNMWEKFTCIYVNEGEVITSLYSLSRRRSEYTLVITEPEATNCLKFSRDKFPGVHK